jgi:hypothetical protein
VASSEWSSSITCVKSSRACWGFHAPTCAFALLNSAFTLSVEKVPTLTNTVAPCFDWNCLNFFRYDHYINALRDKQLSKMISVYFKNGRRYDPNVFNMMIKGTYKRQCKHRKYVMDIRAYPEQDLNLQSQYLSCRMRHALQTMRSPRSVRDLNYSAKSSMWKELEKTAYSWQTLGTNIHSVQFCITHRDQS